MKLQEIAHSRAGDKGNTSNISVIAYDSKDFEYIKKYVTVEVVREKFGELVHGSIIRYELPNIFALNFVLHNALGGGVTRTLSLDIHGKSFSSIMLNIDLPDYKKGD